MTLLSCHAIYSWNIVSYGEILILVTNVIWNRAILRASSCSSMWHLHAVASGEHLVKVQIQIELMQGRIVLPSGASSTSASPKSSWLVSMAGSHHCDILRVLHHAGLHETDITLSDAILWSQSDVSQRRLVQGVIMDGAENLSCIWSWGTWSDHTQFIWNHGICAITHICIVM